MEHENYTQERISMKTIWQAVLDLFNLEKGIFYTLYALTVKPGEVMRTYIYHDRTKLVKPFRFLILAVAIGTILTVNFLDMEFMIKEFGAGFKEGLEGNEKGKLENESLSLYFRNIQILYVNYFNVLLLMAVPISSLLTFIILRSKLNFAEHLVINSYIFSYTNFIYILIIPLISLLDYASFTMIYLILTYLYTVYAFIQVFNLKLVSGTIKSTIVFVLYYTFYTFVLFFLFIMIALFSLDLSSLS